MPQTLYTEEEVEEIRRERQVYLGVLQNMVGSIGHSMKKAKTYNSEYEKDYDNKKPTMFHLIPLQINAAYQQIKAVKEYLIKQTPVEKDKQGRIKHPYFSFLDAGCGFGHIVSLAERFSFDSFGIELNQNLIDLTKADFSHRITKHDILTFKGYNAFDVIYYYSPISTTKAESDFEEKVENDCKVGCIIIANRKQSPKFAKDDRFKRLNLFPSKDEEDWDNTPAGARIYQKVKQ